MVPAAASGTNLSDGRPAAAAVLAKPKCRSGELNLPLLATAGDHVGQVGLGNA